MKYAFILAIALAAACGKEETPATPGGTKIEKPPLTVPEQPAAEKPAVPATDTAKAALDKAIADTKALIEKKQADAKALLDKIKSDPMKAASYQAEADKLQKEIADLQTKLDGYMKEAAK
ncbi:MAG: hypothetical protein L6Q95_16965 [Planctomycetes bacterium]|nr:hypothetical protein [Planctomycetota bacterium]